MIALLAKLEAALTPARARAAGVALALAFAAALVLWFATAPGGVRPDGAPVGSDFSLFHAAGRLALQGRLAQAYDQDAIVAVERAAVPGMGLTYLWRYPPPLALLLAPLGALPYVLAYALWSIAGLLAFAAGLRRLLPGRDGWLLALGTPATFVCLLHGQTAFLTAAAFAWGLALLDRRPILAGTILSLLICKPHFAVLPPLLMLASGRWRALGGFVGSATALSALSLCAFGWAPWAAFLGAAPQMGAFLAQGGVSRAKVPSVFVLALTLHAPQPLAWGLQAVVTLSAVVTATLAWRGQGSTALKGAIALCAVLLLSPYVIDYDLTLATVATALVIAAGAVERPGMRLALAAALATPVAAPAVAQLTGVQLGCLPLLVLAATLAQAYRNKAEIAAAPAAGTIVTARA